MDVAGAEADDWVLNVGGDVTMGAVERSAGVERTSRRVFSWRPGERGVATAGGDTGRLVVAMLVSPIGLVTGPLPSHLGACCMTCCIPRLV